MEEVFYFPGPVFDSLCVCMCVCVQVACNRGGSQQTGTGAGGLLRGGGRFLAMQVGPRE